MHFLAQHTTCLYPASQKLPLVLIILTFVAILPVSATYYDVNNTIINPGATVYIGEQQLNFNTPNVLAALQGDDAIGWWPSASLLSTTAPTQTYDLNQLNLASMYISQSDFGNYPGNWYGVKDGQYDGRGSLFNVQDPSLSLDIFDISTGTVVTGGNVVQGDQLTFRINTNLNSALDSSTRAQDTINAPNSGNIDIIVRNSLGSTYTSLYNGNGPQATSSLTEQDVNQQQWFWGTTGGAVPATTNVNYAWDTGVIDATGQFLYKNGVYIVIAKSRLNGMYDNYLNTGATYTCSTVSQPATITIVTNTVSLSANVESVIRGNPFSVTITGKPYTTYHLWVTGASKMTGGSNNQPPTILKNQAGVMFDPRTTTSQPATNTPYKPVADNGGYMSQSGVTVWNDVAHGDDMTTFGPDSQALGDGTFEYANVTLDQTGARTVEWWTTPLTQATQYTIRVEQDFGTTSNHNYIYDEVPMQVQQGSVTIVAAGTQRYNISDNVQFSGIDTASQNVYLFITGPMLNPAGADFTATPGQVSANVINGNASTFERPTVRGDNTWVWEWYTSGVPLYSGNYTVYAVGEPNDTTHLSNASYASVTIFINSPLGSANISQTISPNVTATVTANVTSNVTSKANVTVTATGTPTVTTTISNMPTNTQVPVTPVITATQFTTFVITPKQNAPTETIPPLPAITPRKSPLSPYTPIAGMVIVCGIFSAIKRKR